jgi:hypothetical protein
VCVTISYRWDSVEAAFDYTKPTSVNRFKALTTTAAYTDKATFISSGTTYYRCIVATGPAPPPPAPGPAPPAPSSKFKCDLLQGKCVAASDGKFESDAACQQLCL